MEGVVSGWVVVVDASTRTDGFAPMPPGAAGAGVASPRMQPAGCRDE